MAMVSALLRICGCRPIRWMVLLPKSPPRLPRQHWMQPRPIMAMHPIPSLWAVMFMPMNNTPVAKTPTMWGMFWTGLLLIPRHSSNRLSQLWISQPLTVQPFVRHCRNWAARPMHPRTGYWSTPAGRHVCRSLTVCRRHLAVRQSIRFQYLPSLRNKNQLKLQALLIKSRLRQTVRKILTAMQLGELCLVVGQASRVMTMLLAPNPHWVVSFPVLTAVSMITGGSALWRVTAVLPLKLRASILPAPAIIIHWVPIQELNGPRHRAPSVCAPVWAIPGIILNWAVRSASMDSPTTCRLTIMPVLSKPLANLGISTISASVLL